ncbi:hypothetical protein PT286_08990 [Neisseriaceae bacterium ESL0693]|nr:hypothetical protein [Neisseriaceae bacterium ESL0693]
MALRQGNSRPYFMQSVHISSYFHLDSLLNTSLFDDEVGHA